MRRRELLDVSQQFPVIAFLLRITHRHRLVDRIRHLLRIPRIDDERSVERMSGASKLGKDEYSMSVALTCDVLVGNLCAVRSPDE